MKNKQLITALIGLLVLSGCGIAQNSYWYGFSDSLGTGSKVQPSEVFINWKGELEVSLTKAADPEWNPDKNIEYPYAGVLMKFNKTDKPVDLSASTGVAIEYRLSGTVEVMIKQKNIRTGREYRMNLPPQEGIALAYFPWESFHQPSWVDKPSPMDLTQVVSLAFMNGSKKQSTAHLTIRKIFFAGW